MAKATTNICTSLQQSLAWCQGTPELPGIKRRIYYISKDQIVAWPTLSHDKRGRLLEASYIGDFELAADASWKYIDILPDKSQLTSEAQGEYPSQTQLNKLTAVHPGVGIEASALSAYVNNNDCVYLVETVRGQFRVVGSDLWQTKSTVAQDLGQGPTGTTGTTLSVEATDECPAPFYTGKIETEDGIINSGLATQQSTGETAYEYNGTTYDDLYTFLNAIARDTGKTPTEVEAEYTTIASQYSGDTALAVDEFNKRVAAWKGEAEVKP